MFLFSHAIRRLYCETVKLNVSALVFDMQMYVAGNLWATCQLYRNKNVIHTE